MAQIRVDRHDVNLGQRGGQLGGDAGGLANQRDVARTAHDPEERDEPRRSLGVLAARPTREARAELAAGRSAQIPEAPVDGERIAAVGAAEGALVHDAILEMVSQEDEPERRPAARAGEAVREKQVHAGGGSRPPQPVDSDGPYWAHCVGDSQTRAYSSPVAAGFGSRFLSSSKK